MTLSPFYKFCSQFYFILLIFDFIQYYQVAAFSLFKGNEIINIKKNLSSTYPMEEEKLDILSYLAEKKAKIEYALENSLQCHDKHSKKLIDSMRYSLLAGGKRIRPIICLAVNEMLGGQDSAALPTAISLEMIHTMSLIHDDLPAMDNDNLRRGKPTNHVIYGEDVAILAGDALLSSSFEYVVTYTKDIPAERIVEVIRRLGIAVGPYGLAGGQIKDLECEGKADVTLEDLKWIHMHKTASLLKASASTGAVLAGGSLNEIQACETFAEKIGLAFQIIDDILDCTSSTEELGKTAGKDEKVAKATYVKLLGLEQSKLEAKKLIQDSKNALSIFGDKAKPLLAIADFILTRKS